MSDRDGRWEKHRLLDLDRLRRELGRARNHVPMRSLDPAAEKRKRRRAG